MQQQEKLLLMGAAHEQVLQGKPKFLSDQTQQVVKARLLNTSPVWLFGANLKVFFLEIRSSSWKYFFFPHVLVTATPFSKEWLQVREVARDKLCFSGCFPEVHWEIVLYTGQNRCQQVVLKKCSVTTFHPGVAGDNRVTVDLSGFYFTYCN